MSSEIQVRLKLVAHKMASRWNHGKVILKINRIADDRLILVGEFVSGQIKLLTPVRTGNLRDSYSYATNRRTGNVGGRARLKQTVEKPQKKLSVKVGTIVSYAPDVEFGNNKRRAKPHIQPGFHASKHAIIKLLDIQ